MASILNFGLEVNFFLCLEYPTVINTTAKIPTNGCSTASNLEKESKPPIPLALMFFKPNGDTKYRNNPNSNCMCVTIRANNEILKSLA